MTRDIVSEIKQEIAENKVLIYMKGTKDMPRCGFSAAAVQVLSEYGIPFKDINLLEDQEKWAAVKQYSDWPTIPQIYIGGTLVGGCTELFDAMRDGRMRKLLDGAGVEHDRGADIDPYDLLPKWLHPRKIA